MCSACSAIWRFCAVAEAGGADHRVDAERAARRQVRERAFGAGEVDQHVGAGEARAHVGGDRRRRWLAEKRGGVVADAQGCRRRRARRPARSRRRRCSASISMWPMRPDAPATATSAIAPLPERAARCARACALRASSGWSSRRLMRGSAGGARRPPARAVRRRISPATAAPCAAPQSARACRRRARLEVSIEATKSRSEGNAGASTLFSASPLNSSDHGAPLRLGALAPDREHVVPAIGVERIGEQRRAQDVAHLLACQPGLDTRDLLLRDDVALYDLDPVRRDRRPGSCRTIAAMRIPRARPWWARPVR